MIAKLSRIVAIGTAIAVAAACARDERVIFVFVHMSDSKATPFVAETSDAQTIEAARAEISKPLPTRNLFVRGLIERGDGGINAPWRWHFVPSSWKMAGGSIEKCDGEPTVLEQHLDEWLERSHEYCPWNWRVSSERR